MRHVAGLEPTPYSVVADELVKTSGFLLILPLKEALFFNFEQTRLVPKGISRSGMTLEAETAISVYLSVPDRKRCCSLARLCTILKVAKAHGNQSGVTQHENGLPVDLYRHFIGRDDQPVNEAVLLRKLDQHIPVRSVLTPAHARSTAGTRLGGRDAWR